ncbi:MAG: InlB B-repeat-containing protein, partial [Acholeplasmatales bacterium]|nr:InlB B-repeat-containing protein [Acholeplasmatales bacterium]
MIKKNAIKNNKIFRIISLLLIFFSLSFLLFSCKDTTYSITFETNGGNHIENIYYTRKTSSFFLPNPIKEGSTFLGWYDNPKFNPKLTMQVLKGT